MELDKLLSRLEDRYRVHFAYDAQKLEGLKLPQEYIEKGTSEVLEALSKQFDLCYTEERAGHYLILPCVYPDLSIRGRVVDAESGEGLPFAAIRIAGSPSGVLADESGAFHLKVKGKPGIQLKIRYIGYKSDSLFLQEGKESYRIALQEKSYSLSDVKINSLVDVVEVEDNFGSVSIETDRLASLPSIMGADPLNSLRLLPGIGGNPESGSGIVMRGSRFDQTMILYDQVPVAQMDHYFGLFSSINQRSIKDIRVFRNGYSAKYSGRIGGMVQIISRDGNLNEFSGGIEFDRNTTGFFLDAPIIKGKWSTAATFRMDNSWIAYERWRGLVVQNLIRERITASTPDVRDDSNRESDYFFNDLTFKTTFRPNEKHLLTFGFNRSYDEFNTDLIYDDQDLDYHLDLNLESTWSNTGLFFRWDHTLFRKWEASLQYSYSYFISSTRFNRLLEVREGDTLRFVDGYDQDNYLWQMRGRYDLERTVTNDRTWRFGAEFPYISAAANLVEAFSFGPDTIGTAIPAVYGEHEWKKGKWNLVTGLRLSFDPYYWQPLIEPRINVQRRISPALRWRSSYGIYWQQVQQFLPLIREGLVPDFWLLNDSSYAQPLSSQILATGLTYKKNGWLVDVEAYGKEFGRTTEQFPQLAQLLSRDSTLARDDSLFISSLVRGEALVAGIDLMASKRFRHLTLWAGGDLVWARNRSETLGGQLFQPYYANSASVKTGLLFNWKKWEFGLTWRWQGGRRSLTVNQVPQLTQIDPDNLKLPDYHRLDASVNYRFKIKRFNGQLQSSFFNLYNRRNVQGVQYTEALDGSIQPLNTLNLGFLYNLKLVVEF